MNPMEGSFRKPTHEQTPTELFLTKLGMHPGTRIKLVKISSQKNSDISVGESLEGVLDTDIAVGKSIFLDKKSKNTSPLVAVKEEGNRIFFKTDTSIYELVPPSNSLNSENTSEGLKRTENAIRIRLEQAQNNALMANDLSNLFEERSILQDSPQTLENVRRLNELDEKLKKHQVFVKTLVEFRMLMNMLGKNYYRVNDVVTHENAHVNKASSLGVIHDGYSVLVYKSKSGEGFSYQPMAHIDIPKTLNKKDSIETSIKIGFAPEEYGNHLSDGDESRLRKLREELKKYE